MIQSVQQQYCLSGSPAFCYLCPRPVVACMVTAVLKHLFAWPPTTTVWTWQESNLTGFFSPLPLPTPCYLFGFVFLPQLDEFPAAAQRLAPAPRVWHSAEVAISQWVSLHRQDLKIQLQCTSISLSSMSWAESTQHFLIQSSFITKPTFEHYFWQIRNCCFLVFRGMFIALHSRNRLSMEYGKGKKVNVANCFLHASREEASRNCSPLWFFNTFLFSLWK